MLDFACAFPHHFFPHILPYVYLPKDVSLLWPKKTYQGFFAGVAPFYAWSRVPVTIIACKRTFFPRVE